MPLFEIKGKQLEQVALTNFALEKHLQSLVEGNLEVLFASRFVASEFVTGTVHQGRIDTLALSEDGNPVIIEYKKIESSELINQSLYYLHWLIDHKGDFEKVVLKTLGPSAKVDWSAIRVICIAPNYRKYDLHAVQVMGSSIELWGYRLFKNQTLYLEEVYRRSSYATEPVEAEVHKDPIMVAAGKKAALTRATGSYTFEEHLESKSPAIRELAQEIDEFVASLDQAIEAVPKKLYVAYKLAKNIVCMEVQQQKILLFLKVDPKTVTGPSGLSRDVTNIGHFGTGDLEITVKSAGDLELAKPFIKMAYEASGG
jgi:predicted transport protein